MADISPDLLAMVQQTVNSYVKAARATSLVATQYTPQINAAYSTARVIDRKLQEIMSSIAAHYRQTLGSDVVIQQVKTIQALYGGLRHIASMPNFTEVIEAIRRQDAVLDQFILILADLGWTPALHTPISDVAIWVEAFNQGGLDAIREPLSEFLTNLYDEEVLLEMIEEWRGNSLLTPRMRILERAVRAHINGDYDLSVPALLAQVEGFVVSIKEHQGWLKQGKYKEYLLSTAGPDTKISIIVERFVTEHLLEKFEHGDPIPEMSRNAILHGADLQYGTCANSLKVILLLDWLQSQSKEHSNHTNIAPET